MQTGLYRLRAAIEERAEDEAGLSSVEWVALIAIVVTLLGAIGVAFKDNGHKIGEVAVDKLAEFIRNIK
ncbi:MAG: hypothetical protein RMJ55_05860 [Roseiflexaceae bacterium]|nr:hypothetical protein [Roseiflexaceae bacterium]